jgi:hypothetical protein
LKMGNGLWLTHLDLAKFAKDEIVWLTFWSTWFILIL